MYFGSDLLFWCTLQLERLRLRLLGIPIDVVARASADDKKFVSRLVLQLLPGSLRVDGILNDIAVSNPGLNEPYALEQITTPTLMIHAKDDRWGSFEDARRIAARIPGGQFRPIESGGHMLLGHREAVRADIAAFVGEHSGP